MASDKELKEALGTFIASKVHDGAVLGLGTGSSAEAVLHAIGKRISSEGIKVWGVTTSVVTTSIASDNGITVIPFSKGLKFDWGFDGADEVTPDKVLLKGRGGAMFKEKLIACMLPEFIISVTEDKLVKNIGERYPVPVEVAPSALPYVERELVRLGATSVTARTGTNFYGPLFTENGNSILDVTFSNYSSTLEDEIKVITGVIEHGIFSKLSSVEVVVASKDGEIRTF
jgi:ribose 5-phosphate isomerase A